MMNLLPDAALAPALEAFVDQTVLALSKRSGRSCQGAPGSCNPK